MNDDAVKTTKGGSSQTKGNGAQIDEIPKTVPIDTVALQERQKARRRETGHRRPWAGIILTVVALVLLYFVFG
ncbi:MAG: hypothetical protein GWN84_12260 [Gammaproteobacteria bacterium]|nr:hypothetical protein [Gammaproteobacteria bacterium]NIR83695.1 hypothetical protein [Gammaproteobacteria bacterium]NIR91670.1 hypothetical protein [Gammaproteobacteria bacterium]NIU04857.1 hypothetical protein [Gammaproteobacteria bacterium]NIV51843.1 hypothetical protein [Gammaproteobacteria bacterium]